MYSARHAKYLEMANQRKKQLWPVDDWSTSAEILERAKPGDLIEFERIKSDSYWAVYIGDGWVVTYGYKAENQIGIGEIVKKERMVVLGNRCRINNLEVVAKRLHLHCFDPDEIVRRAEARIGEESQLNLLEPNCEIFATECRFGKGFTYGQVMELNLYK